MPKIYACELVPPEYPPIEPIEAPIPFENVEHFEKWLREKYIPKTLTIRRVPLPNTPYDIDINKTECWAIFSPEENFEKSCQVYPFTDLTREFEETIRGKILSHNHFSDDSTLSCFEVRVWANLQMKEFKAVTQSKTYSIKPKNQRWPDPRLLSELFAKCPSIEDGKTRHCYFDFLAKRGFFEYSVTDFSI